LRAREGRTGRLCSPSPPAERGPGGEVSGEAWRPAWRSPLEMR
jgi:hypothetical protein